MRRGLLLLLTILTTCYYAMGQERKTLFHHQGFLLSQEGDNIIYVKNLQISEPHNNYYPEMDSIEFSEVAFTMVFDLRCESKSSINEISVVAQFVKDSTNYKIFEWSYLNNWFEKMDDGITIVEMSFQAAMPKYTFAGYSDDEKLLEAKVWNYIKEHFDSDLCNLTMMGEDNVVIMASEDQAKWTLSPRFHENFADHFLLENNLVTDKEGKLFTGEIKVLYAADKICSIWNYKDGELNGDQFLYYQNQNLHAKYFCKKNTTEGELIHYYENGNIWFMVTMKAGVLDGHVIFYYPNGNKEFEGNAVKDLSLPHHGMRNGHWIYYWENGKKKAEGTLLPAGDFEVRSGIWIFYDDKGEVIETKDYTNERYIDMDSSLLGFY